jgi:hypothetical protein
LGTDTLEKVLEKLATTDKSSTIVVERLIDGKMRITSGSWDGERVFARDQVLEVSNVEDRLHVARKTPHHGKCDPPIAPYASARKSSKTDGL